MSVSEVVQGHYHIIIAIVEPMSSVSVNEIGLIVLATRILVSAGPFWNLSALIASDGVCKKGRAEE